MRVLEVENYGIWVHVDRRPYKEDATGYGVGFGYKHDRREFIPLDCRVVIRVPTVEQLDLILETLNSEAKERGGICVVQDSSIALQ